MSGWKLKRPRRASLERRALGALALLAFCLLMSACATPGAAGATQWQTQGPSGATVLSLAADPFRNGLIYAGTTDGNVYRTLPTTLGIAAGSDIPRNSVVGALLADPRTQGRVYAGTNAGFYVSTDNGDHWTKRGTGLPSADSLDALNFGSDGRTLLAGTTQHGVYRSQDDGVTWQAASTGLPANANVNDLLSPAGQTPLLAAIDAAGVFASTDGGQTWSPSGTGIPAQVDVYALAVLPSGGLAPGKPSLYAGTSSGLYASTDGGKQWSALASNGLTGRVLSFATDSAQPSWLYAGTDKTVLRSKDGGQHWSEIAPGLSHQVAAILAIPQSGKDSLIYAAAGSLVRFPAYRAPGSGPLNAVVNILLFAALIAVGVWVYLRARRQVSSSIAAVDRQRRDLRAAAPPSAAPPPSDTSTPADISASNGHKPAERDSSSPSRGSEPGNSN